MAKSTAMTVRLKPEVREKLDALARDTNRSAAHLANVERPDEFNRLLKEFL